MKDEYIERYNNLQQSINVKCVKEDIKKQIDDKLKALKEASKHLTVKCDEIFLWLEKLGNETHFSENEALEQYKYALDKFKEYYEKPYSMLPEIFYYKETILQNSYNLNSDFFDKGTGNNGDGYSTLEM